MHNLRGGLGAVLLVGLVSLAMACGDDETSIGVGEQDCAEGEILHPITEQCVPDPSGGENGSSGSNGGQTGNNDTNNDSNNDTNNDHNNDTNNDHNNDSNNDSNNSSNNTSNTNPGGTCGIGHIEGQTCRPDGLILAHATVTLTGVDCETGQSFTEETQANAEGYYAFYQIPSGTHTMEVVSGSFSTTRQVQVITDQTTDLWSEESKICIDGGGTNIAVLSGQYDNVGSLLGGMAVEYNTYSGDMDFFGGGESAADLLMDINAMNQYDIIFVECGGLWGEMEMAGPLPIPIPGFGGGEVDMNVVRQNLRTFVENGNSLYASDLAQPFISESIPEAVQFYQQSQGTSGPQAGVGGQTITADVNTPEMQAALGGATTTNIEFPLGGWAVAEDAGSGGVVHFRGDADVHEGTVQDAALMVMYNAVGGGRVIFTSFHNSDQATGDMEAILEFAVFQL